MRETGKSGDPDVATLNRATLAGLRAIRDRDTVRTLAQERRSVRCTVTAIHRIKQRRRDSRYSCFAGAAALRAASITNPRSISPELGGELSR